MTKTQMTSSFKGPSSWVSSSLLAQRSTQLSSVLTFEGKVYWLEARASDQGRSVLVACDGVSPPRDMTTSDFNVRSSVNEYGGGAYTVAPDDRIIFSNGNDHKVYQISSGECDLLGGEEGCRYADFTASDSGAYPAKPGVFCVREDHRAEGQAETSIVWMSSGVEVVVIRGADFYAAPRLSPDGRHLALISWNHPDMPWDETELSVAALKWIDGLPTVSYRTSLVDKAASVSVMEPHWHKPSCLMALSDKAGAWRPVTFEEETGWVKNFLPDPGFEVGDPPWVFGHHAIITLANGDILAHGHRDGWPHVARFDGKTWHKVDFGLTASVPLPIGKGFAWLHIPVDASPCVRLGQCLEDSRVVREAFSFPDGVGPDDCALPVNLTCKSRDGGGIHVFYYPPSDRFALSDDKGRPPLLVIAHGGPTAATGPQFSLKVQWWTSRGFAVLDVNYRGSTGWGRSYRKALDGEWGALDVADCIDATRDVCAQGLADPARCVIRGSSSGGLTVLRALALSDCYCAGTSLYGVTDLKSLAGETHKFESRYLDRLVGKLPEAESIYRERSPVEQVEAVTSPVLFLHGDADRVVPLSQARDMHAQLSKNGVKTDLKVYRDEGHGFRQSETLRDAYLRELSFYLDVFREGAGLR